jgi:hypothetical protein
LPLSLERFIALSKDNGDGQNNSILRACSKSKKVCTLASWVVYMPKKGIPELYIKLIKPEQKDIIYRFILNEQFWTERFRPG